MAILDEAFKEINGAIANTEKNLANARELFESYLNAIFTHKGDGWVKARANASKVLLITTKIKTQRKISISGLIFVFPRLKAIAKIFVNQRD
ncbi:hypothetical protein [Nostoc sp.]